MKKYISIIMLAWWFNYLPNLDGGEYTFGPFGSKAQCDDVRIYVDKVNGTTSFNCYEADTINDEDDD